MAESVRTASFRSRFLWIFLSLVTVTCLFTYSVSQTSLSHVMGRLNILPPLQTTFVSFYKKSADDSNVTQNLQEIAKQLRVKGVDCVAVSNSSKNATDAAKSVATTVSAPLSDEFYLNITENCTDFQKRRGYIMDSLSEEEKQFPLAYSVIVYKDTEMVERLLRAIYRPQNVYCIHVDNKASMDTFKAISAIANCFTNVFITSQRISVVWGRFSVLEPELLCMQELWRYRKWKYFINLTGQEFPLKTNYELVKILTAYDGAVDVSTTVKHANKGRWRNTHPPFGLTAVKGSVHIIVNREYVDYILHNKTAEAILNWTKNTEIPDETFFAVLNANPSLGIRGTYKGEPEYSGSRPFLTRFKNWGGTPCAGKRVRGICILTTGSAWKCMNGENEKMYKRCYDRKGRKQRGPKTPILALCDLPLLFNAVHLFANKFFLNEDRVVIGCLEEKIFNDTRDGYIGTKFFNTTYYENVDFVKNKV